MVSKKNEKPQLKKTTEPTFELQNSFLSNKAQQKIELAVREKIPNKHSITARVQIVKKPRLYLEPLLYRFIATQIQTKIQMISICTV